MKILEKLKILTTIEKILAVIWALSIPYLFIALVGEMQSYLAPFVIMASYFMASASYISIKKYIPAAHDLLIMTMSDVLEIQKRLNDNEIKENTK